MTLGWGPTSISGVNDGDPSITLPRTPVLLLWHLLPSRGWWNYHRVWTGEELGLMTILPLHPVVLTGRSLQYLHYLPASPCGADLGRLDDNVVSVFCVHRSSPPPTTYACPQTLYRGTHPSGYGRSVGVGVDLVLSSPGAPNRFRLSTAGVLDYLDEEPLRPHLWQTTRPGTSATGRRYRRSRVGHGCTNPAHGVLRHEIDPGADGYPWAKLSGWHGRYGRAP
jgi:hypothetical protein